MARKDLDALALEYREGFLRQIVDPLDHAASLCESPLERAMLWALIKEADDVEAGDTTGALHFFKLPGVAPDEQRVSIVTLQWYGGFFIFDVFQQLKVTAAGKNYRLDFGIRARRPNVAWKQDTDAPRWLTTLYALECDGHDFHERTKEQAERDRVRDRDLQSIGWNVARFTGAEIYRDPLAAAVRVFKFGEQLLDLLKDG
jgi:hypothetical protein